jgi:radical SAM superfamily enzyme YgiQ (UPF0313 family)
MVYKKGPPYRVRPVKEICEDVEEAAGLYGKNVKSLFFPAGNTIAMPTEELAAVCRFAAESFSSLQRITVYGSSQYLAQKGLRGLKFLREAGLSRIHVGLESGDDFILKKVKKGTTAAEQIEAGRMAKEAGIELSEYVILGLGGIDRTVPHAQATAETINAIGPDFVRLRTLVPKINTLLLHQINKGRFHLLSAHQVLEETRLLIENIMVETNLTSDHYTNYVDLEGTLPGDKERLLAEVERALGRAEDFFRPHFVGEQ